jgi:hypothetical protein
MPFIKQNRRRFINQGAKPKTIGELNFKLTKIILDYLPKEPRYEDYNAVIGVLECAKLELYRKRISIYEDLKEKQNGKVY